MTPECLARVHSGWKCQSPKNEAERAGSEESAFKTSIGNPGGAALTPFQNLKLGIMTWDLLAIS